MEKYAMPSYSFSTNILIYPVYRVYKQSVPALAREEAFKT